MDLLINIAVYQKVRYHLFLHYHLVYALNVDENNCNMLQTLVCFKVCLHYKLTYVGQTLDAIKLASIQYSA